MTRILSLLVLLSLAAQAVAVEFQHVGSFRLPAGYAYGGRTLAYDPQNNSVFLSGNDQDSPNKVGEVAVPGTLGTGAVSSLPIATSRQPVTAINRWSRNPRGITSSMKSGGLFVLGNQLLGTAYEYYDADTNARDSHYVIVDKNKLSTSQVNGVYQVGTLGGGYSGGHLCSVPEKWQGVIGKPMLCGGSALPINSRTSNGPCALGFDPAEYVGGTGYAPIVPLIYYPNWGGSVGSYQNPNDHPLALPDTKNDYYNTSTEIKGCIFVGDEIVFIGSHGTGPWSYTQGGSTDPGRPNDNVHAPPYRYQTWTYDANQLRDVIAGTKKPWDMRPVVAELKLPYTSTQYRAGGVSYDPASGRVFIAQPFANGDSPVVHVYSVGTVTPPVEPPVDPPVEPVDPTLELLERIKQLEAQLSESQSANVELTQQVASLQELVNRQQTKLNNIHAESAP